MGTVQTISYSSQYRYVGMIKIFIWTYLLRNTFCRATLYTILLRIIIITGLVISTVSEEGLMGPLALAHKKIVRRSWEVLN